MLNYCLVLWCKNLPREVWYQDQQNHLHVLKHFVRNSLSENQTVSFLETRMYFLIISMWILPFLILSDLKKISNVKDLICETKLTGFSKWISGILKFDWMDFVTGFKIKRSGYWSTDGYWIMEFSIAIDSKPKNNDDSCFIGSV